MGAPSDTITEIAAKPIPKKYRKKSAVITAVQFIGDHAAVFESSTGYGIHTLEHVGIKHEVTPSDWIITGVAGEVYSCKDTIFRQTYEPVGGHEF